MKILIKNGLIIDPLNNINEILDILIIDRKISQVDKNINVNADYTIDAKDKIVVPGLIDLHVHLREPGFTHKETIETGSKAAAIGGVTTICAMPNTNPVIDNKEVAKFVLQKGIDANFVNVLPIGSVTLGQKGETLSNFSEMKEIICGVSEDGGTVKNSFLMKKALEECSKLNLPMFAHCEDTLLKNGGQMNQGLISEKFGIAGISNDTEDVIIGRDIILAQNFSAKLHICHISTEEGVNLVKNGKLKNKNLTCEVAPHHFTLIDEDIKNPDTNFKMSPPLRGINDKKAILNAISNDTIDVIATDHAPHHFDEKNVSFEKAANGIVGLETLVPLCITELVNTNVITLKQFVEKTSVNPAKIIGIDKGNLSVGKIADIAIIDISNKFIINTNKFHSKSKNSPFNGKEVVGKVTHTIVSGKIIQENGELKNDN